MTRVEGVVRETMPMETSQVPITKEQPDWLPTISNRKAVHVNVKATSSTRLSQSSCSSRCFTFFILCLSHYLLLVVCHVSKRKTKQDKSNVQNGKSSLSFSSLFLNDYHSDLRLSVYINVMWPSLRFLAHLRHVYFLVSDFILWCDHLVFFFLLLSRTSFFFFFFFTK